MNHFQCETYILHSGRLRQGIQSLASNPGFLFQILSCSFGFSKAVRQNPEWKAWVRGYSIFMYSNCNIKVTRLPEVGVTIKCKWGTYHGILYCVVQLHRSQFPMYELFGQLPVCMTRKHGLYASFSAWTTRDLCTSCFHSYPWCFVWYLHFILLTLLQHKDCKYDYTLTVPLTSACCVHSNVYGLCNIHWIRYLTAVDPSHSTSSAVHKYHTLISGSVEIPLLTTAGNFSSIGKVPVS